MILILKSSFNLSTPSVVGWWHTQVRFAIFIFQKNIQSGIELTSPGSRHMGLFAKGISLKSSCLYSSFSPLNIELSFHTRTHACTLKYRTWYGIFIGTLAIVWLLCFLHLKVSFLKVIFIYESFFSHSLSTLFDSLSWMVNCRLTLVSHVKRRAGCFDRGVTFSFFPLLPVNSPQITSALSEYININKVLLLCSKQHSAESLR